MKKALILVCVVCVMLCLFSCKSNGIKLNEEKSFFSDVKIENDKVYIYCTLFLENHSNAQKVVEIKALLENDAKNGLLKEAKLYGYTVDENSKAFHLEQGENQIHIVFIGEYAGTPEKVDRRLPEIEIIEIKE